MNTFHPTENLEQLSRCTLCGSAYDSKGITLLEENDQQTIFHMACSGCGVSVLLFMSSGQFGIVSIGMVTDLNKREVKNFYRTDSITPDQVIEVHQWLKRN
jgi:hypothetical protein